MKNLGYINHMNYIYAIYQEKSFTRAAEKLYISQPAISLTVKKIESEIGYPIFERCGKEIVLTPIGEKYIRAIEEIMRIQEKLEAEVDDILKLKKGNIKIGSTTFVASYMLPDILRNFKTKYPSIDVGIVVEQSTELEEKLENDELDLVIDNASVFLDGYKYTTLLDERVLLGVPKNNPINKKFADYQIPHEKIVSGNESYASMPKISMTEFSEEKFILLKRGNKLRQVAGRIFDEHRIIPNIAMEFDRLHTAVSYSEAGFGACFLSDTTLKYSNTCDNLCIYLPETEFAELTLYIVNKKSRYLSSAASEFIDFMKRNSMK